MAGMDPTHASWASMVCFHTGHLGGTVKMAMPTYLSSQIECGTGHSFPTLGLRVFGLSPLQ